MEKIDLKRKKVDSQKADSPKLPENVARKYEALVTPKVLIFQNPERRIDMRTMSLEEADALAAYSPIYLKLKKGSKESDEPAEEKK